jgi:DNA-binding transcriptional MocR family regulator
MNSGATSERVFDGIKRQILSRVFHPGQRLDPALLAQAHTSSITPVRDALHLLTGLGLVKTGLGEGFHVPHIDEPALKDLYAWTLEVLLLAIRSWYRGPTPSFDVGGDDARGDPASMMAALCVAIARRSSNAEHLHTIQALNDRLQPLRIIEIMVIEPVAGELETLDAAFVAHDGPSLRSLLVRYHRRRSRKAAEIVRAHYRIER